MNNAHTRGVNRLNTKTFSRPKGFPSTREHGPGAAKHAEIVKVIVADTAIELKITRTA